MVILYRNYGKNARCEAKESLGEYGSGWEWDSTWPKVFDNEKLSSSTDEIGNMSGGYYPTRYINTVSKARPVINDTWVDYGTGITSTADARRCPVETTNGEILVSGSYMNLQQSCEPHTYNGGNYYSYPAAALGNNASNSICPKGWRLPGDNSGISYSTFLRIYGIDFDSANRISPYDAALLNLPLSFLHSGYYLTNGALYDQGLNGYYRMSSLVLSFGSGVLRPTSSAGAYNGYSVRCVSR